MPDARNPLPQGPPPAGPPTPRIRKGPPIAIILVAIIAVMLVGGCVGLGFIGLLVQGFTRTPGASYAPPTTLVTTDEYGVVPPNHVWVVLGEGDRDDAMALAESLGGTVVGEVADIDLYQLRTSSTDAAGLSADLAKANDDPKVTLAFPDQDTHLDLAGVQCSPLAETFYAGDGGRHNDIVGTQRAWNLVRGSGLKLSSVKVAVLDQPLYRDVGEYDGKSKIVTSSIEDRIPAPAAQDDGSPVPYGTHGNAVTSIIAADPDNGGVAGIASVLGDKLEVEVTNVFGMSYGSDAQPASGKLDPGAPTTYKDGAGWSSSASKLVALKKQVSAGAKIINCSWGNSDATPEMTTAFKRFFEYMADKNPDVLFVCSAGNDGRALDGSRRIPSGLALPNVITVGNILNDGSTAPGSSRASKNYEVTLAVPASGVLLGVDDDGAAAKAGGTSFAAPQVTAAAALLRALDPKLQAADIKMLLTRSAMPGVTAADGKTSRRVSDDVGGRVLSIDRAVEALVGAKRAELGLPPLDPEAGGTTHIGLLAEKAADGRWAISAALFDAPEGGTDVALTTTGAGSIGGKTTQRVSPGGEARWTATVSDHRMTVHVKRADTGACWRVTLGRTEADTRSEPEPRPSETPEPQDAISGDMAGAWYFEAPQASRMAGGVECELDIGVDGRVTGTTRSGPRMRQTGTVQGQVEGTQLKAISSPDSGRASDAFDLLGSWDGTRWTVYPNFMLDWKMDLKRR